MVTPWPCLFPGHAPSTSPEYPTLQVFERMPAKTLPPILICWGVNLNPSPLVPSLLPPWLLYYCASADNTCTGNIILCVTKNIFVALQNENTSVKVELSELRGRESSSL